MERGRLNQEKDLFFKQKHVKVALEENYKRPVQEELEKQVKIKERNMKP